MGLYKQKEENDNNTTDFCKMSYVKRAQLDENMKSAYSSIGIISNYQHEFDGDGVSNIVVSKNKKKPEPQCSSCYNPQNPPMNNCSDDGDFGQNNNNF